MESSGPPQGNNPSGPQSPGQGPQSPGGPPGQPPGAPQGPQAPQSPQAPQGLPPAPQSPQAPAPQQPGGTLQQPGGFQTQPAGPVATADPHHGQKFPMGRAWGFTILTFGLWGFYWFYTTRKEVDLELGGQRDDALLHTLGLLIPILNFFCIYWLWRDISLLCQRSGVGEFSPGGYLAGLIVLSFIGLGAPIFYSLVLSKLNEFWDRRAGGVAPVRPVATAEKVVVGIGIALLLLYFLIIVIVIIAAAAGSSTTYG
jgi:hypothetical protein